MWTRPVLAPPETIDLAAAITKKNVCQAAEQVAYVKKRHPEVTEFFGDFKFRGQRQKKTPVADLRSAVELTFLLPGRHAARIRRQAAELLCRYLGGDLALVDEVCRNRGCQEQLAVQVPEDPRRLFGEVVEATGGTVGSATTNQLAVKFRNRPCQIISVASLHASRPCPSAFSL